MPPRFNFTALSVIESGRTTRRHLEELKGWLNTTDLPRLTDEQAVLFLLSCDNDREATRATVTAHYRAKRAVPEVFDGRDVDGAEIRAQLSFTRIAALPERTPEGHALLHCGLRKSSFVRFDVATSSKLWFMVLESIVCDEPPEGLIILFDMENIGLMHLTRLRPEHLRNFFFFLQEGLEMKLHRVHVFNTSYFIGKAMALVRPFMKKELIEMINFYPPKFDMKQFHEVIPARYLPREMEGELPSLEELHLRTVRRLRELKTFFDDEERQRKNENV